MRDLLRGRRLAAATMLACLGLGGCATWYEARWMEDTAHCAADPPRPDDLPVDFTKGQHIEAFGYSCQVLRHRALSAETQRFDAICQGPRAPTGTPTVIQISPLNKEMVIEFSDRVWILSRCPKAPRRG